MGNNADYGLTLQKLICDTYGLQVNETAESQYNANYNKEYEEELKDVIPDIFEKVDSKPAKLLTYSKELTKGPQTTSPHNFLLENGKTLSVRTTKTSDKVAPRTVGQAGFPILNEFFAEIYGEEIVNQSDVRKLVYEHIHEILPVFIDNLFQSDYTVFIFKNSLDNIQVIKAADVADVSFSRNEYLFKAPVSASCLARFFSVLS